MGKLSDLRKRIHNAEFDEGDLTTGGIVPMKQPPRGNTPFSLEESDYDTDDFHATLDENYPPKPAKKDWNPCPICAANNPSGVDHCKACGQPLPREGGGSNVTNIDLMDKDLYDSLADTNRSVKQLKEGHPEQVFYDLLEDAFASFYKYSPRVLDQVSPTREMSKQVIRQLMDLKEYEELRKYTRGDEVFSVGSLDAVKHIFEQIPPEVKKQQQLVEQQEQQINDLIESEDFKPGEAKSRKELASRLEALQQMQDALGQKWDRAADQVRAATREALTQAKEESEKMDAVGKALGWGNEAGTVSFVDMKTRIAAAQQLRNLAHIKQLAEMAGKFINIAAKKQAEKLSYDRQIIEGIEDGNNLIDVVPEEWFKFFTPSLQPMFLKQYAEESLRQYKLNAKEPQGKGPIAVYIDCSGSMGGNPIMWASAVALALFFIARKQKRWFMCTTFNTRVVNSVIWPKNKVPTIEEVQKVFGLSAGGGTAFDAPLKHFIDFHKRGGNTPMNWGKDTDLIFITDGECDLRDPALTEIKTGLHELKASVYSVMVGTRGQSDEVLYKFSDRVWNFHGNMSGNEDQFFDAAFSI